MKRANPNNDGYSDDLNTSWETENAWIRTKNEYTMNNLSDGTRNYAVSVITRVQYTLIRQVPL